MKKPITPNNVDELKAYLEKNGLEGDIIKFKLEAHPPGGNDFGLELPETYRITAVFDCQVKDD
jgi:hypothetical protein